MVERVFDANMLNKSSLEVIGKARGALGRVSDYYTRDRSTPRQDEDFVSSILSQLSIPSQEKDMC